MAHSALGVSSKSVNRTLINHLVDQAILSGLRGGHKEVAVGVFLNAIQGLTGALGKFLVEALFEEQDLIGLNTDIAGLALGTTQGLVNHDPRVLQAAALTRSTVSYTHLTLPTIYSV